MLKWMAGAVVAGAGVYVAYAAATGRGVPLVGGGKGALWTAAALGMTACGVAGIGAALERTGGSWNDPFMIAGCVLGVAGLAVVASAATGVRPSFLAEDRDAFLALAGIIAAKVAVSTAHGLTAAVAS